MKVYLTLLLITVCLFLRDQSIEGSEEISKAMQSKESSFHYIINDFALQCPAYRKAAKGRPFKDPIFNSTLTRITDAKSEAHGQKFDYAFPGYPKHDIENADGTLLLVQTFRKHLHIWNAKPPYNKIKDIPTKIIGWGER